MPANHNFAPHSGLRVAISDVGWADYRAGLSFPAAYERMTVKEQRNYENGRLRAANTALALGRVPPKQLSPRSYNNRVFDVVGSSYPKKTS